MTTRYSLDVDGVVADYFAARERLGRELGIRPLTQPVGLEPEELDAFMKERQTEIARVLHRWITENMAEFFGGVACTITDDDRRAIARAAAGGWELFWVSARSFFGGKSHEVARPTAEVHAVTVDWLARHGLPADPAHVILTPDKAATITEKGIKYHLDDAVAHVTSIALRSPAKVYLIRRPWNQRFLIKHDNPDADYITTAGAYGVAEVDSIREYIALITGK